MEHVSGIDVSWMTHGPPKDKDRTTRTANGLRNGANGHNRTSSSSSLIQTPPATPTTPSILTADQPNTSTNATVNVNSSMPRTIPRRPSLSRSSSTEKKDLANGTSPSRRSWFTNISSKFSSSVPNGLVPLPVPAVDPAASVTAPPTAAALPVAPLSAPAAAVPRSTPNKNAVLQHGNRPEGEEPYTPAPPRSSGQTSFLGVFRRLSSSGGMLGQGPKTSNHGLVERRVLNVDQHRERCRINELDQAKLRRVAFCVDVEIAPMPRYVDGSETTAATPKKLDKSLKQKMTKMTEKGEGDALKRPKAAEEKKEAGAPPQSPMPPIPAEAAEIEKTQEEKTEAEGEETKESSPVIDDKDNESAAKKKEKKKKSEEERKARKEKKRKLAEANGTIPMEIHMDSSDSASDKMPSGANTPRTTTSPTISPVRIYRRCCQLRESPILKKITEQLLDPSNSNPETGVVTKVDLTGYWMQLGDLVTLGDYLAVVPVRELILENCGLTDEGLRVVLAGLLATKATPARRKVVHTHPDGLAMQGGVVERLVLKNNKIGPEGWKHICLFVYLCRSITQLDLSSIQFPRPPIEPQSESETATGPAATQTPPKKQVYDAAQLFGKAIGERLAGPTLELINMGDTDVRAEQLGVIIDGVIKSGVRRMGLANNNLDEQGVEHVARLLAEKRCEGLDLGGNDLRAHMEAVMRNVGEEHPLWALSLADCNLEPKSLCKIFPRLAKLKAFRFIDLSHNPDLFKTEPSALPILRRYLPKMESLKRIDLSDVGLTLEPTIAIAEILPELPGLAQISLLDNPELLKLAHATTEEQQEEACALYAALLAATRISRTIVSVDLEVPGDESGEIVKAMAKAVVAYCLRNMERGAITDIKDLAEADANSRPADYPDMVARLVGHDVMDLTEVDDDEAAPDEDYVIGGTGVAQALACCLKNRLGDDSSRRQSGEFIREVEEGLHAHAQGQGKAQNHVHTHGLGTPASGARTPAEAASAALPPPGRIKDTSMHLLMGARKIRIRLQPALAKAKANSGADYHNFRKLSFLDQTLEGIIKRFEDEFPDARPQGAAAAAELAEAEATAATEDTGAPLEKASTSSTTGADVEEGEEVFSDREDTDVHAAPMRRSDSVLSTTARALGAEEGRALRAGHRFRANIAETSAEDSYDQLLRSLDEMGADPNHARVLSELLEELGDEGLLRTAEEKGVVATFRENRDEIVAKLRMKDPEYWEIFRESIVKAVKNTEAERKDGQTGSEGAKEGTGIEKGVVVDENAVED